MTDDRCGAHYAQHPSQPHLVAVCTLPPGHEGDHDNRLPKPAEAILRRREDRRDCDACSGLGVMEGTGRRCVVCKGSGRR